MKQRKVTDNKYWDTKWNENKLTWHSTVIHKMLYKHFEKLTEGRTGLKFFFPLCGKAVDMLWVYNLGHTVVGVEFNKMACEQFFTENNLKFTMREVNGLNLFTSQDNRIKIYNGDFFKFNKMLEGEFDCVWDRGSFVAIQASLIMDYCEHIRSLLKPDFRYLLDAIDYDPDEYEGPPHSYSINQIREFYGSRCFVEQIDEIYVNPFNELQKNNPPKKKYYIIRPS